MVTLATRARVAVSLSGMTRTSPFLFFVPVVVAWVGLLACEPFGSTHSSGPSGTDAASVDDGGLTDGTSSEERDGTFDAAPCAAEVLLLGSKETGNDNDEIPVTVVDAYGYQATAAAGPLEAGCAWLYVASIANLNGGNINVGVYGNGAGSQPNILLTYAKLTAVKVGWNAAPLDPPLPIAPGTTLWLGFTPTTGSVAIRARKSTCAGQLEREVCMYTSTPDQHFIVGQHPRWPRVIVLGGFSGHGYKMASVMGEIAADLIEHGRSITDISLFDPRRFG
jgi:hypothetical protein